MITLYLIRHGETEWNAGGRFQGHQNTSLSETGRKQAHRVAHAVASLPFQAVYTSDLARSAETADIVAKPHGLTPIADRRLREAFFGEWEGLTLPDVTERWPDIVAAWREDSLHTRPPGGETLEQVERRVGEFLQEIIQRHQDGTVAIVAHGGSLRAIITITLSADLSIFRRLRLDNCSISIVTIRDSHYSLVRMNDICHLDHEIPRASWDEAGDQWRVTIR